MPRLRRLHRDALVPSMSPEHLPKLRRGIVRQEVRDNGEGVCSLPPHLWCWIAQYHDVTDSNAAMQCSLWLRGAFEVEALWYHHSLMIGVARLAHGAELDWKCPFVPKVQLARCVNWRLLLQVNMRARGRPAVWVRVAHADLRMPLQGKGQSDVEALVADLSRIVAIDVPLLQSSVACAAGAQWQREWPMRLRFLQWGGRPGKLLPRRAPLAGARVLLEWALPGWRAWPLPPNSLPARNGALAALRPSAGVARFRPQSVPLLRTWLPCTDTGAADAAEQQRVVLLRVMTSLVPREVWMEVDVDASLGVLHQEVAKVLKSESPLLADVSRPIQVQLLDQQSPKGNPVQPESTVLRDMFWAQSETLMAQLDPGDDVALWESSHTDKPLVVKLWRSPAFTEERLTPSPAADDLCLLQAAEDVGWSRQMSDPVLSGWSRQVSEPLSPRTCGWSRQASEPAPAPVSSPWWAFLEQCSSPAAGLQEGAHDATSHRSSRLGSGAAHPGDIALELEDELILGSGSNSRGGGSWERVVPHYHPRLLAQTLRTRQFEFHPTMTDVMLIGDKKGNVNVLDTEAEEMHPPLQVGTCPLLGLVWMRHHPQIAVCGASHSGEVMFLKYDPHTRVTEPALHRQQTVEEFPKLSSLSANCTDDFLLASGISPNIAVYDVQTGRVLHRAHGVHEHFINISRFCHTSPHIFATASFDHTCKVWDLRQPISHDRPLKTLSTGGHNVMCVFSPDDKHVLCSGVDTRIMQFDVPSWRQSPESFPLREPVHRERYRRSTYLADGRHFVTAATEESHMHLMSVTGQKLGVIDFRGVVQDWAAEDKSNATARSSQSKPSRSLMPRWTGSLQSHFESGRGSWPFSASFSASSFRLGLWQEPRSGEPAQGQGCSPAGQHQRYLMRGAIQLDDADPNGGSSRNNHEFVQSIRTHPVATNRVGVLLSLTQGETSYVALVDLTCD